MPGSAFFQPRSLLSATRPGKRAARMEMAARGRRERRRDLAADRRERAPATIEPRHFREQRLEIQHALIRAHPLALLVSSGDAGLKVNPVPFLLDATASALGTLCAHVARANPQ